MTVRKLVNDLGYKVIAGENNIDKEIEGVYICDLLSWVMSHAIKNDAWITVQTNINVVAVALLTEVACVIIPEDIEVEQGTIDKANEEGIPILSSSKSQYNISIDLYKNI